MTFVQTRLVISKLNQTEHLAHYLKKKLNIFGLGVTVLTQWPPSLKVSS